jgi:hypothetical protein
MNKILGMIFGLIFMIFPIWIFCYFDTNFNFAPYRFAAMITSVILFAVGVGIIIFFIHRGNYD